MTETRFARSSIASGGHVAVQSHQGLVLMEGTYAAADGGGLNIQGRVALLAARDMDVAHDITTDTTWEEYYRVKRKWYGSKKVTQIITSTLDETVNPSEVMGRSVSMAAGGHLNLTGSVVFADGAVGLHADADLNLLSADEAHLAFQSRYVKKSGIFGNGGLSISIGSKSSLQISQSQEVRQSGSSVSSLAGDIMATAGNQYLQMSSDLTAPLGDIQISARNIAVQSNNNTRSVLNTTSCASGKAA